MIALGLIGRFIAAHWRAALVALVVCALFALGWHQGAAHVGAQWTAERTQEQAAQAKALSAALANQKAAEGKVAAIDKQFTDEVSRHANDILTLRAQLASGADRVRVHVASCAAPGQSASAAGSADGPPAVADLAGPAADGVAEVAGDDQREIDKLVGLQNYVRAMQEKGFIEQGDATK
jgi:hypothetical protein